MTYLSLIAVAEAETEVAGTAVDAEANKPRFWVTGCLLDLLGLADDMGYTLYDKVTHSWRLEYLVREYEELC